MISIKRINFLPSLYLTLVLSCFIQLSHSSPAILVNKIEEPEEVVEDHGPLPLDEAGTDENRPEFTFATDMENTIALAKTVQALRFLTERAEQRLKAAMNNSPRMQADEGIHRRQVEVGHRCLLPHVIILATIAIFLLVAMVITPPRRHDDWEEQNKRQQKPLSLKWAVIYGAFILSLVLLVMVGHYFAPEDEEMMRATHKSFVYSQVKRILEESPEDFQAEKYQVALERWLDMNLRGNEHMTAALTPPTDLPRSGDDSGPHETDDSTQTGETQLPKSEIVENVIINKDNKDAKENPTTLDLEKPLQVLKFLVTAAESFLPKTVEISEVEEIPRESPAKKWEMAFGISASILLSSAAFGLIMAVAMLCMDIILPKWSKKHLKSDSKCSRRCGNVVSTALLIGFGLMIVLVISLIFLGNERERLDKIANEKFRKGLLKSVRDTQSEMDQLEQLLQTLPRAGTEKSVPMDLLPDVAQPREVMHGLQPERLAIEVRDIMYQLEYVEHVLSSLEGKFVRKRKCQI